MSSILDHVLFVPSPNRGGALHDPSLIVVHYTASTGMAGSVNWLKNPQSKASAHLVIGQDGELAQLVPFSRCAWHAGVSTWNGKPNCNLYSVGVELVNPGPLARRQDGSYVTVCNSKPVASEDVFEGVHHNGGPYLAWHRYADAQLDKLTEVVEALRALFPSIKDVVGHDDVAPGRKHDVGPAFRDQRPNLLTSRV